MTEKKLVTARESLRFVGRYWRQTPYQTGIIMTCLLGAVATDVALPSMAKMLTSAIEHGQTETAKIALLGFMGCGVGFQLLWQFGYRLLCKVIVKHMKAMLQDSFAKVQVFSSDWQANTFAGATTTKLTRGMRAFDGISDTIFSGIVPITFMVLGNIAAMMWHQPIMGMAAAAGIVIYTTAAIALARYYIMPSNREANTEDSALSGALADAVTCNATVKTFGAEARETARLHERLIGWGKITLRSWLRRQDVYAVMAALATINQAAILGVPVLLWTMGKATAADVAYALTAYFLVQGALRNVGNLTQNLQKGLSDIEDVVLYNRLPLEVEDKADATEAHFTQGEIRFKNVDFCYKGQDAPIYKNLNLHIKAGETVGLVGASGSGKSTFIKLLQRLYDVTDGAIEIDGQTVQSVTQSSLRQHIALVPQDPVLFHRSLLDNIRYARPDASEAEVMTAAQQAHAHEFIARLPQGYQTLVGERGIKLSGGERQRVAIARAILSKAPILVLDEATSSLDSVSEALIQQALDRLMKGRTTLIVAHRLSTLRAVDRILVFDKGQIVEDGSHTSLLAQSKGRYRTLYETQQLSLVDA